MRQFSVRLALALCAAAVIPTPSLAAMLRSTTSIQHPQVLISDLFDDAGPDGDRVLGPGPAPGGRIVVEAAQAAAIARQFGVSWHPSSGNERAVIDRPGRTIARAEVMGVLRAALSESGAPDDSELEMPDFSPPLVAIDCQPKLTIEQLSYDAPTSQFSATMSVVAEGEQTQRVAMSGTVQEMTMAVIPVHRLLAGDTIQQADVEVKHVRAGKNHVELVHDISDIIGQSVRHTAMPGKALLMSEVTRATMVARGSLVAMQLQTPGVSMEAMGTASESGALGDRIHVINPGSGAEVEAQIIGPGRVQVSPDARPRMPAHTTPLQVSLR